MSDCHFGFSPVNYPDPDPGKHKRKSSIMNKHTNGKMKIPKYEKGNNSVKYSQNFMKS